MTLSVFIGADCMEQLEGFSTDELTDFCKSIGMKPLHTLRLFTALEMDPPPLTGIGRLLNDKDAIQ